MKIFRFNITLKHILITGFLFALGAAFLLWTSPQWLPLAARLKHRLQGPHGPRNVIPDKADFMLFLARGNNRTKYREFHDYLKQNNLSQITSPQEYLRQGTDWKALGEPAFAIPPRELWPNILPTLRLIRSEIIPVLGPVEVVSGFRTRRYNKRASGARGSRHLSFQALDLVPKNNISRKEEHRRLLKLWKQKGKHKRMGLGLYSRKRFHIDSHRYRKW